MSERSIIDDIIAYLILFVFEPEFRACGCRIDLNIVF